MEAQITIASVKSGAIRGTLQRIAGRPPIQPISFSPREVTREEMAKDCKSGYSENWDNYDDYNNFPDAPYPE